MRAIDDYYFALRRLIDGKTQILPKGAPINNDSVSLEAGRKRGSIKKSRQEHKALIEAIEAASLIKSKTQNNRRPPEESDKQKLARISLQEDLLCLKKDYELALGKIISLTHQNHQLRQEIEFLRKFGGTAT
ncbi:hypothetical protein LOY46_09080 [Pseudomonas sichuanensis]|uniref:hypothetical protein n=1 Tax=Pseudomonas sichuanensis TaxID=2213015 RepID=UPI002160979E|nr:hypothetical protein [Pseudomonas sichuanensis]UVK84820.1 hypothetical protein LOY46_09080 [Pseudomonas sichuanensis]UVL91028.1 hypothetical protein LOY51_09170 [Pseudomonas sichuanensis]